MITARSASGRYLLIDMKYIGLSVLQKAGIRSFLL